MRDNGQSTNWHRYYLNPDEVDPTSARQADRDQPNGGTAAAHDPEIYDIEDLPTNMQGTCPGDQTVKPYAIEEPDEEAPLEPKRPTPPRQGRPRYWEDLIDSMEELHCESDNSNPGAIFSRRGRKRKPTNSPNLTRLGQSSEESSPAPDVQYEKPSLSPKRPRTQNERRKDSKKNIKSARRRGIDTLRESSGSSSPSTSTDTSGANHTNGSPASDAMDLD
ncbi:hypothetical protein ASPVEDRAFT_127605 [Aspergillus versicolor CBS 583.65]|uniref:Uncharacterized protein n=1 Tax=Aspergillus versicolor CBS 583.65 TaxID=1036611 RepID=A0A1L9PF11_ASPVE|nr:uncharacterized protein ASPVEDRAFT_127605 [Aspergillus versicolor CBS 583.65]OJJ00062.1 hypothetical protein ASPVEDRAFT_127605 [Aspergillus versicolor CBS 583.65]